MFIYESIEQIIQKYKEKEGAQQSDIHKEIEGISRVIGRKIIDLLVRDIQYKFQTQLDTMKFICTEFWKFTFAKQVDNLRTNNAGTFIFTDEAFRLTGRISNAKPDGKELRQKLKCYEYFVAGLVKGALMNMGYESAPIIQTLIQGVRLQLTVTVNEQGVSNS